MDSPFLAPLSEETLTPSLRRSLSYRGPKPKKAKDPDFEKQHPRGTGDVGGQFVRKGDSGAEVRAVQRKTGAKVDGSFGRKTAAAVRRYQRANGLQVDGVVGRQTAASMLGRTGKLPLPGKLRDRQRKALRGIARRTTTSPSRRRRTGGGSLV